VPQVRPQGAPLPLRVVVNGGGPAGLINAVTAYTAGAAVVVLEQRAAVPTRSVWFDLTSSAHILRRWQIFSPAQDLLAAFGWGEQETEQQRTHQAGILHVSCGERNDRAAQPTKTPRPTDKIAPAPAIVGQPSCSCS
jgi:2-polyprenyl-6-methoxyphenol hydroxylase-like FAD-dependent oxidoreductase